MGDAVVGQLRSLRPSFGDAELERIDAAPVGPRRRGHGGRRRLPRCLTHYLTAGTPISPLASSSNTA